MTATYYLLLPKPSTFSSLEEVVAEVYSSIPEFEINDEEDIEDLETNEDAPLHGRLNDPSSPILKQEYNLTTSEKFTLAKPLIIKFMLPLFFVYFAG